MDTPSERVPARHRFLVHDTDGARGRLIAGAAGRDGHVAILEPDPAALRVRLVRERWDALAVEILAGPLPASIVVLDLRRALRRAGIPMPPTLVYVRGALASRRAIVDRLLDEVAPTLERVGTDDPELVVRALERLASARRCADVAAGPGTLPATAAISFAPLGHPPGERRQPATADAEPGAESRDSASAEPESGVPARPLASNCSR